MDIMLVTALFIAVALGVFFFIYFFVYRRLDKFDERPLEISLEQLTYEYSSNKDLARQKFNNKFLEVTGKISQITYNGEEYVMTLYPDFNCYFKYANFPIVLLEGEIITVKGIFFDNGNLRGLKRCSV